MIDFNKALLRLKEQAGIQRDKEIAELLGLTDKAFNARKSRGAFPEDKLFALATRRPDLRIDPNYVLHGATAQEVARQKAESMLDGFPARLREVRGKVGPAKFAKRIGVSVEELAQLEAGARRPTAEEVRRYVEAHPDQAATWLLGGEALALDENLSEIEIILVRNYRMASAEGQEALRRQAAFLSEYASRPQGQKA